MEKSEFFSYSWHIDEEETNRTVIRIYGLNSKNESVCIIVNNFLPYVYLELPDNVEWDDSRAGLVASKLNGMLQERKPVTYELTFKKRLYYANIDKNNKKRRLYPYLRCCCSHTEDIRQLGFKIRKPINIPGIGAFNLKMHEHNANPILQLTSMKKLPTAGWIAFLGKKVREDDKITHCKHEYTVKWENMAEKQLSTIARPLLMGYDIEVNSSIPSSMPKAHRPEDKIFQISCVFARQGCKPDSYERYLLTLGEPDTEILGENVEVLMYGMESDLLLGFVDLIQEKQPNIIIGYNIFTFDIPYMIDRAKFHYCIYEFARQCMTKYGNAKERTIEWSSSAYKNQSFQFLDAEGRIFVDLLPLVRRDYKMNNYQLKTIASHFLKDMTKDPLDAKAIFKCYRLGMKGGPKGKKALGVVGKYCLAEGTNISGIHGTTKIENLKQSQNFLLSWDERINKIVESKQVNFFNNGIRECVELELEDGTTVTCTPDHKISLDNSEWKEAGEIPIGTRINIGPILPHIDNENDGMIMSRLLGYILSDGHLDKQVCNVYVGNIFDAENICKDIEKICGIQLKPTQDQHCWKIYIPSLLACKFRAYKGVTTGNRTKNDCGLPDFSGWEAENINEFLGGLFGRDGWSASLQKKERKFSPIGLTQSRSSEKAIVIYMDTLQKILSERKINSSIRIRKRDNLYIGSLTIRHDDNEKFMRSIGYRYCYHKTLRTSVCVYYQRLRTKTINSYKNLYEKICEQKSLGKSISDAYKENIENVLYPPTYGTVKSWIRKGFPTGRPAQAYRTFPKADEFIRKIGAEKIFGQDRENYHTYANRKNDRELPVFYLELTNRKNVGAKQVYDIEVMNTHSFMANGIIVHNCVKDSELVVRLFETLTTWIALCEMSKVTNVQIFQLYTQGQQLKVFSQAYKKCTHENTVVEKDGYITKEHDHYVGATVFPPIPGVYDKVVPFDFCLAGDTLISLANGCSKRIDSFYTDEIVLGSENNVLNNYTTVNGLQKKGLRDTVKIWFQDGTTVTATPEHKFMTDDGEWHKACDLENKYVRCGIQYTEDKKCSLEENWSFTFGEYTLDMQKNREKSLAFARILGYILSDGSIYTSTSKLGYTRLCAEVAFGTLLDAENFKLDLGKFCDNDVTIRKHSRGIKGTTYCISIPASMEKNLHYIENIVVGKRSTQSMKLPKFLLEDGCPMSIVREFLGGLFGGDGTAPCLCSRNTFGTVSFKWTTIEKYKDSMEINMLNLKKLLEKFNLDVTLISPIKIQYRKGTIIPKDSLENPRWDYQINIREHHSKKFLTDIGFRYCVNKSLRLTAVASYQKMQEKTREQHGLVLNKTLEIVEKLRVTTQEALDLARQEIFQNQPVINEYSLSSVKDIGYQKHEAIRHKDKPRKISLQSKKFPKPRQFLTETNTLNWFVHPSERSKKIYAVSGDSTDIPCFRKKVIAVIPDERQLVFDIEVSKAHNFLANGVITHNCSLYPTTIIAYNISWDTLVEDETIPDDMCHVMEWHDDIGCQHDPKEIRKAELNKLIKEKDAELKELRKERDLKKNINRKEDFKIQIAEFIKNTKPLRDERSQLNKSKPKHVICAHRKYRWLKKPMGVLPEILTHLLDTRKATKNEMKVVKGKMKEMKEGSDEYAELSTYYDVLDQRQLALKVSANSGYGCMGVRKGYLPFMPGAMVTTYMGRKAIEKAADSIQKDWKGVLVYGDTDSNYVNFPHLQTAAECWDYSIKVAKEVSKLFPPPMSLAYEEKIYWRFFILTKKRYMSLACERDGVLENKISKKGVLLQRRDNCAFVRKVYGDVVMMIFNKAKRDDVLYYLITELNKLCSATYPVTDFIVTKSVGDVGDLEPHEGKDKNDKPCYKVGDYKVKLLPTDEKKKEYQFKLKNCTTEHEYYLRCLPAQVQLAEKMRERGALVSAGSRLEYVITTKGGHNAKQYEKIEDSNYFSKHSYSLEIDYLYYLKQLANPLDQIIDIIYTQDDGSGYKLEKGFMLKQHKYRLQIRGKMISELKKLFAPKLKFDK